MSQLNQNNDNNQSHWQQITQKAQEIIQENQDTLHHVEMALAEDWSVISADLRPIWIGRYPIDYEVDWVEDRLWDWLLDVADPTWVAWREFRLRARAGSVYRAS